MIHPNINTWSAAFQEFLSSRFTNPRPSYEFCWFNHPLMKGQIIINFGIVTGEAYSLHRRIIEFGLPNYPWRFLIHNS